MNERVRRLNKALERCSLGSPLVMLDETASTNDILKTLADAGAPEGCTVVAQSQTDGRGRMGRKWLSLKGKGLYMSVLLRPRWRVSDSSEISMFSALAVARALNRAGAAGISLKWPNDVLCGGGKIAGILVEPATRNGVMEYCVVGVGINVSHSAKDLAALSGVSTSSCRMRGARAGKDRILVLALEEMERCYRRASRAGRDWIAAEWAAWSWHGGIEAKKARRRQAKEKRQPPTEKAEVKNEATCSSGQSIIRDQGS